MGERTFRAALIVGCTAAAVAALDLTHKAHALDSGSAVTGHERSGVYLIGVTVLLGVWAAALVLCGSRSIALAGGIVGGGATGNVASLALWPSFAGVANPLVARGVAFSIGDVAVGTGLALVLAATVAFAVRNPERLRQPIAFRRASGDSHETAVQG
ncbi:MAG: hypothetical protein ABR583_04190 [Gaiellaceae bacterium]